MVSLGIVAVVLFVSTYSVGLQTYRNQREHMYSQELETQIVQAQRISQTVYFQILLKKQVLRDLARLPEIKGLARTMPDSRNEQDFLANPYYNRVQDLFTAFMEEDNVDFLFMGSIHSSAWVGPEWVTIGEDYEARVRNWFVKPRERLDLYVSTLYAPTNAPDTRVITLNVPIMDGDTFIGSLGLDMSMTPIFRELELTSRQTGNFYSLHSINYRRSDQEYYIIYHPAFGIEDDVPIAQAYLSQGLDPNNLDGFMEFMLDTSFGKTEYGSSRMGRRGIIKQGIPETDWIMVVDYSIDRIERYLRAELLRILGTGTLVVVSLFGIAASFIKLRSKNNILQDTLKQLVRTQDQLVETSKQNALGYVIMGLAHEINTPLGNAVVLGSIVSEYAQVQESRHSSPETRELVEQVQILQDSLQKIVNMVDRFKQLDVITRKKELGTQDLGVIAQQEFDIVQYHAQQMGLKIHLHLEVPDEIPQVGQEFHMIFKELFENTLTHGFPLVSAENDSLSEPLQDLVITLRAWATEQSYIIHYRDSGRPVEQRVASTLFEPFVTTDRKSGRIGLGLFIVSGIIHNLLHGVIELEKTGQEYRGFLISWPKNKESLL